MPTDMGLPYAEVIGDPVAHSKSPMIHSRWLALLGIKGEYRATRVRPAELPAYLEKRQSDPDWRGCNLTIPHKVAALDHLNSLDCTAEAVGAANCVVPGAAGLIGYNSDVDGVAAALDGIVLKQRKATIVGGGGAARAAIIYLSRQKVSTINVVVRNPKRAQDLKLLAEPGVMNIGSFDDASSFLRGAAIVVNASPLGMAGCPEMPRRLLNAVEEESGAALFDMVYDPRTTAFLSTGRAKRIGGMSMLVGQAARAFELFFGVRPPPAELDLRP